MPLVISPLLEDIAEEIAYTPINIKRIAKAITKRAPVRTRQNLIRNISNLRGTCLEVHVKLILGDIERRNGKIIRNPIEEGPNGRYIFSYDWKNSLIVEKGKEITKHPYIFQSRGSCEIDAHILSEELPIIFEMKSGGSKGELSRQTIVRRASPVTKYFETSECGYVLVSVKNNGLTPMNARYNSLVIPVPIDSNTWYREVKKIRSLIDRGTPRENL